MGLQEMMAPEDFHPVCFDSFHCCFIISIALSKGIYSSSQLGIVFIEGTCARLLSGSPFTVWSVHA